MSTDATYPQLKADAVAHAWREIQRIEAGVNASLSGL